MKVKKDLTFKSRLDLCKQLLNAKGLRYALHVFQRVLEILADAVV